jgi:hypothetical protein
VLVRNPALAAVALALVALAACAPHAAATATTTGAGTIVEVEALDKFGAYRARRLVIEPVAAVRLAPGDAHGEVPRVATLGRERDAGSILLLRFAIDLPPDAAIMGAYVVLDRVASVDPDPRAVPLHAARIVDPWDVRSIAWGRAPRLDDAHLPATRVDGARGTARIDVRSIVQRWRRHAPEDQGIAILADGASTTGMTFAFADGAPEDAPPALSVRSPGPPSLYTTGDPAEGPSDPVPRGPRLELYVRP